MNEALLILYMAVIIILCRGIKKARRITIVDTDWGSFHADNIIRMGYKSSSWKRIPRYLIGYKE